MTATMINPPRNAFRRLSRQSFQLLLFVLLVTLPVTRTAAAKLGDLDNDGIATIHDVVAILDHINGRKLLDQSRHALADLNRDGLITLDDVDQLAWLIVVGSPLENVIFNPRLLAQEPYTNQDFYPFRGIAVPNSRIQIHHAYGLAETRADRKGNFTVEMPLLPNRAQSFFLTGFDETDTPTGLIPLHVLQDKEGPIIRITSLPEARSTVEETISLAGTVGDDLSGLFGLKVRVNGAAASVFSGEGINGSFLSEPIALEPGPNQIKIEASDAVGNETVSELSITRQLPKVFRLIKISGDRQTGDCGQWLDEPIAVQILGPNQRPITGKPVRFQVLGNRGAVASTPTDQAQRSAVSLTDAEGYARMHWRLSALAGAGNYLLRAASRDIDGTMLFAASARPLGPGQLHHAGGNNQKGETWTFAPHPLRLWVSDGVNPLSRQEVHFRVLTGGGNIQGQNFLVLRSDAAGFVETSFFFGPDAGRQQVQASIPDQENAKFVFSLYGVDPEPDRQTTLAGVAFSPFYEPIEKAYVEAIVEGVRYGPVRTEATGYFQFSDLRPGPGVLQFWPFQQGGRAVDSPPIVTRELFLIEGTDNRLEDPLILPLTAPPTTVPYNSLSPVSLTLPGVAGFQITIGAGAVLRADGTPPTAESPLDLSLIQIPVQNLPVPAPIGRRPLIAWLLQPTDLQFLAPPRIQIPDLQGLSNDFVAGIFGFDPNGYRFDHLASTGAEDEPARFRNWTYFAPPRAGFGFIDTGQRNGRAAVTLE